MVSTSSALLYNKMESRHPWRTHVRVKGSDRRPFILVLDSILVYATCVIQFNWCMQYVNEPVSISELMQSKKDKINSKDIAKNFYSVYLTHQLCHKK